MCCTMHPLLFPSQKTTTTLTLFWPHQIMSLWGWGTTNIKKDVHLHTHRIQAPNRTVRTGLPRTGMAIRLRRPPKDLPRRIHETRPGRPRGTQDGLAAGEGVSLARERLRPHTVEHDEHDDDARYQRRRRRSSSVGRDRSDGRVGRIPRPGGLDEVRLRPALFGGEELLHRVHERGRLEHRPLRKDHRSHGTAAATTAVLGDDRRREAPRRVVRRRDRCVLRRAVQCRRALHRAQGDGDGDTPVPAHRFRACVGRVRVLRAQDVLSSRRSERDTAHRSGHGRRNVDRSGHAVGGGGGTAAAGTERRRRDGRGARPRRGVAASDRVRARIRIRFSSEDNTRRSWRGEATVRGVRHMQSAARGERC
mmetsp:Transcript_18596/g.34438  ORF Transcript_18596/g.34438 Transcript_18596/m.34438 type:complete len:364 (-) Transcript_18596:84-1175(-)